MKFDLFVSISLCVGGVGCVVDPADELAVASTPLLAANGLSPAQMWGAPAVGPGLVTAALSGNKLTQMAEQAGPTLRYAVACALGPTQSVTATINGTPETLYGNAGFATTWATTALSMAQRNSISACIISLVNQESYEVSVSLRGLGLAVAGTEGVNYVRQDGAYWGNLFNGVNSWASACAGSATVANDTLGDLWKRECAESVGGGLTGCNFRYAGACSQACSGGSDTAGFASCDDGVNGSVSNVITVNVI